MIDPDSPSLLGQFRHGLGPPRRTCTYCKVFLEVFHFNTWRHKNGRDYHNSTCRGCDTAKAAVRRTTQKHKDTKRKWCTSEVGKLSQRKSNQKPLAQKRMNEFNKSIKGKRRKEKHRAKLRIDPGYRMADSISTTLSRCLANVARQSKKNLRITGLQTAEELMQHMERQFESGMTRENYGRLLLGADGWDIEHKIPQDAYDKSCPEDMARCWNYHNLRPCWHRVNVRKSNNIDIPLAMSVPVRYRPMSWQV